MKAEGTSYRQNSEQTVLLFSVTILCFHCPIPSSQSCARHLKEQVREEMAEVPAGWVSPLIQQLTVATFHTVAKAMGHKATNSGCSNIIT